MKKGFSLLLTLTLALCIFMAALPVNAQAATLPDSVTRIYGKGRCETAMEIADAMQEELGVDKFDAIVYASSLKFADALAGSYLSAQKNAPILLHLDSKLSANLSYIQEHLSEDGIVYILGGSQSVPEAVDSELDTMGIRVQRLEGRNRFLTNLDILKESGFSGGTVLVCTSKTFADSLSASATGLPILLVSETWTELSKEYQEYLEDFRGSCEFIIIGGESAVLPDMEQVLKGYGSVERLSGKNRYETSVLVAERFFNSPTEAILAYALDFPDGLCGGPLAYSKNAPLILTNTGKTEAAEAYAVKHGIANGAVLGGEGLISDEAVISFFSSDYLGGGEYGEDTPED